LSLEDLSGIESIAKDVLENIDIGILKKVAKSKGRNRVKKDYPFPIFKKFNGKISIVNDKNFSFLYYDNLKFFEEMFDEVVIVDSTKDEIIDGSSRMVYIPGGYVESEEAYNRVKNSLNFRNSLIEYSKNGVIYAECAGLLYLAKKVDDKKMSV